MWDDPERLRGRLQEIADKTHRAMPFERGTYGRGKAETRRYLHDRKAGRHCLALAHDTAVSGLAVFDRGEADKAAVFLWAAERHYIAGLEAVADLKKGMGRTARPSGRPAGSSPNVDIDRALADAFDAVDPAIKGDLRMKAAKRALPPDMRAELSLLLRPALHKRKRNGRARRKA